MLVVARTDGSWVERKSESVVPTPRFHPAPASTLMAFPSCRERYAAIVRRAAACVSISHAARPDTRPNTGPSSGNGREKTLSETNDSLLAMPVGLLKRVNRNAGARRNRAKYSDIPAGRWCCSRSSR